MQGEAFEHTGAYINVRGNGFITPNSREDIAQIGLWLGIIIRKLV